MEPWWRRDGAAVVVTLPSGDDATWAALQQRMYGIALLEGGAAGRARVLSLPEAYYALAEDRLLPPPPDGGLVGVWRDFRAASPSFAALYAVYHHFRRLGWLVRSGLNYGAQFVLYRGDADAFHSEYIVYLFDGGGSASHARWHAVQALTRVAEDVKKTVVLCEVSVGGGGPTSDAAEAGGTRRGAPAMETHGCYRIHGEVCAVDTVLIRFWDTATVDEDRASYVFAAQPIVLKKKKKQKKKRAKKTGTNTAGGISGVDR